MVGWPLLLSALRWQQRGGISWADAATIAVLASIVRFLLFSVAMSAVVYLHHTHPRVVWTGAVRADAPPAASVHVVFPRPLNWMLHRIMEHTAHHARPGIPLYELARAQALLETREPDVIVQPWSLAFHLDTLRRCKLFDLRRKCWVGFDDAVTSAIREASPRDRRPSRAGPESRPRLPRRSAAARTSRQTS
jgi:omega-6 fatty acid desaturase (delta-12 desaturase)